MCEFFVLFVVVGDHTVWICTVCIARKKGMFF
jgi:hypothetical protein